MTVKSPENRTKVSLRESIDSIEHLIGWIAPRTAGRQGVVLRFASLRQVQRETHRLREALCLLSRDLEALFPQSSVIRLAKRRVRSLALALAGVSGE